MKYENAKSILLILLVIASVFLTWNLWTYQPKDDFNDTKNMHDVSISDQEEPIDLIKPMRFLYHVDDVHYGTVNDSDIDELIREMSLWTFYDIENPKIFSVSQLQELSHANNRIEINYPDLIPFDSYKGVLHIDTKTLPNDAFDRIVINLTNESQDGASSVYFINSIERKVYESHVNRDRITTLITKMNHNKTRYETYKEYALSEGRLFFLPEQETEMTEFKFYSDYIDPDKFKYALFSDPSRVRRDILADGEKFTDDKSMMNVNYLTNMILYINPGPDSGAGNINQNSSNILKRSIDFVNEHSGWTDNYRFFTLDELHQRTIFQLFMEGRPVFNEQGMAEIRQTWGSKEIYQYRRPYFSIDMLLPGQREVVLPSGELALKYLKKNIDIRLLEDLLIGYKLSKDPVNPKVLVFEPSWYYLYGGSWLRLSAEDIKGDFYGLE